MCAIIGAVLGLAYDELDQRDEAIYWLEMVSEIEPHFHILSILAERCSQCGHFTKSASFTERMMALNPHDWTIQSYCAMALLRCGRSDEARALLGDLVNRRLGGQVVHSNYVVSFHDLPQAEIRAVHEQWGQRYAPMDLARSSHNNDPNPDRRLHVGYLSSIFFISSCTHYFEPILEETDRDKIKVFGYGSDDKFQNAISARVIPKFDVFRDIRNLNDKEVVQCIEQDDIDILVAYFGYTKNHRLRVLAYKPAPIQVNLSYINTLGIKQVDYRISDRMFDPPGSEGGYLEETLYLPGGLDCYRPPENSPALSKTPALRKGHFTFGSFCAYGKMNHSLIRLWAQVLLECPTARMLIKCYDAGQDPEIREAILGQFERHNVSRDRIQIKGRLSDFGHLALFNEVDAILDTYPYNGIVTTTEALWMGVPVVTLTGQKWIERAGLSLLTQVGLESFAASTPEKYIAKAKALAASPAALDRLRSSMRQRMLASPLCDAKRLCRELEVAYRQMWRRWCQTK